MWDLLFEYAKENPPPKKPRNRFYKGLMTPAYREYLRLYADWERIAFEAIAGKVPPKLPKKRVKNVMELIKETGSEDGFEPTLTPEPTRFRPGSKEKVEELRRRVEMGEKIWASEDSDGEGIGDFPVRNARASK